jgi:hypothetical protein
LLGNVAPLLCHDVLLEHDGRGFARS